MENSIMKHVEGDNHQWIKQNMLFRHSKKLLKESGRKRK